MTSKNLTDRLIRIEREIAIYKKGKDRSAIEQINIDRIPLDTLKDILSPKQDDPLLYGGYILTEIQLDKINQLGSLKINTDFEKYIYVLECNGIYDWNKP